MSRFSSLIIKLDCIISDIKSDISKYALDIFNEYNKIKKNSFIDFVTKLYSQNLLKAKIIQDVEKVELFLNELVQNITKSNEINNFFYNNLQKDVVNRLKKIESELNYLAKSNMLQNDILNDFLLDNKWVDENVNGILNELKNDINRYYKFESAVYNPVTGDFVFKGFFEKLSSILELVNNNESITNLKSVKIFTTNSLILDTDYKIESTRYQLTKNAPDLLIISQTVISNNVSINLSCDFIPQSFSKAQNGFGPSGDGADGMPGLPGFNGGSLLISANHASFENLKFISIGGKGGDGQDGIIK